MAPKARVLGRRFRPPKKEHVHLVCYSVSCVKLVLLHETECWSGMVVVQSKRYLNLTSTVLSPMCILRISGCHLQPQLSLLPAMACTLGCAWPGAECTETNNDRNLNAASSWLSMLCQGFLAYEGGLLGALMKKLDRWVLQCDDLETNMYPCVDQCIYLCMHTCIYIYMYILHLWMDGCVCVNVMQGNVEKCNVIYVMFRIVVYVDFVSCKTYIYI